MHWTVRCKVVAAALCLSSTTAGAFPCDGQWFQTQADVDAFGNSGCTIVNFYMAINGTDLRDLTPLRQLTSIEGDLMMHPRGVESLSGLENLQRVSGSLTIEGMHSLRSLEALEGLRYIGKEQLNFGHYSIYLRDLPQLTSLRGLHNLRGALEGRVWLEYLPRLSSLRGLEGLTSIDVTYSWEAPAELRAAPQLKISQTPRLQSLAGLDNLTHVRDLLLEDVTQLANFTGLGSLTHVEKIKVVRADGLTSCAGLTELSSNFTHLELQGLGSLQSLEGLEVLGRVSNLVVVEDAPSLRSLVHLPPGSEALRLVNLAALPSLVGLEDSTALKRLELRFLPLVRSLAGLRLTNRALTSLNIHATGLRSLAGLEQLTNIENLVISSNNALASLSGLSGLVTAANVEVSQNQMLRSLLGLQNLRNVTESIYIRDNPSLEALTGLYGVSGKNSTLGGEAAIVGTPDLQVVSNPILRHLQDFPNLVHIAGIVLQPNYGLTCYPDESRSATSSRVILPEQTGGAKRLPTPVWNESQCKRCPSACGTLNGIPVDCDFLTGRCRCPLGLTGFNCAEAAPTVRVVRPQIFECHRGLKCSVTIRLHREGFVPPPASQPADSGSGAAALAVRVPAALAGEENLEISSALVRWENDELGFIDVDLHVPSAGFRAEPRSLLLEVGYSHFEVGLNPDFVLADSIVKPLSAGGWPIYPWCLDSGECRTWPGESVPLVLLRQEPFCPGGQAPGSNACVACEEGTVSPPGPEECRACSRWTLADEDRAQCLPSYVLLGCWAGGFLALTLGLIALGSQLEISVSYGCCGRGGLFFLGGLRLLGRAFTIEDVSFEKDRLILTTTKKHGLRVTSKPFRLTLESTGHPLLDRPHSPLRARVVGANQLALHDDACRPILSRMDTSMGLARLSLRRSLWHSGWPVPMGVSGSVLVLVGLGLLVAMIWTPPADASQSRLDLQLGAVVAAVFSASAGRLLFRSGAQATALQQRLEEFKTFLSQQSSGLKTCDKGPNRGLEVRQLLELLSHFQRFILDRSMYYVVSNLVLPITKPVQLSYAELAGPQSCQWFVSHFWGDVFSALCSSLQKHAETLGGDGLATRYWICSFSINQYMIKEELGESWAYSSFYQALSSDGCRGTCLIVDEQANALTRSWCLFEVSKTIELERNKKSAGLLFCTRSGMVNQGQATVEVSLGLAARMKDLRLEDAGATEQEDKDMIDNLVESEMGGFAFMNRALRRCLASALLAAKQRAVSDFEGLEVDLLKAPPDPGQNGNVIANVNTNETLSGAAAPADPPDQSASAVGAARATSARMQL